MKSFVRNLIAAALGLSIVSLAAAGGNKDSGNPTDAAPDRIVVDAMAYGDNSNQEGVNWVRIVRAFEKKTRT